MTTFDPAGNMKVGDTMDIGNGTLVSLKGYDPLRHNLFGLDVLHQDQRWIDKEGNEWRLDEMTAGHRRNLLAFLRRRAVGLAFNDSIIMLAGPMAPGGEMACDAVEQIVDEMWDDPSGWLESTKLVTRLRELVEADDRRNTDLALSEVGF